MNSSLVTRSALAACVVVGAVGCGPVARRDLGSIPQRQITFDDMCHLQDFFDQRNAANAAPFRIVDEQSTESANTEPDEMGRMRRAVLGEGTYVIEDRSARRELAGLLDREYRRLPPIALTARGATVRIHAGWWASGEMRRLRPDTAIELVVGRDTVNLPFDPCIGEFLFGARVYSLRRNFIDSERARARGEIPPTPPSESPADADASSMPPDDAASPSSDASPTDG